MDSTSLERLLKKYDQPVPRYTSYPTVPYWHTESFSQDAWVQNVHRCFSESNSTKGISLYVHLPFCESHCTYCACNMRATRNHGVERRYIGTLLREWELYLNVFGGTPLLREIHLGGGTPTFFSPDNLRYLMDRILEKANIHGSRAFSFEGHPNNTTYEHLNALFNAGFRRVSFGVQDLDPKVQQAIHRIQPFENLERVTHQSRELGYTSISFDLVYGLPYQTLTSIEHTIGKIITLRPERISFYSYAHVPWMRPGQRGYEDADLPSDVTKRALYESGRRLLLDAGYLDIGMDHFALPEDELARAQAEHRLHRNFMGYTTTQTDLLIGLGASSISDAGYAYAQNLKKVEDYEQTIHEQRLALLKGHVQTESDRLLKRCILELSCHGFLPASLLTEVLDVEMLDELKVMQTEGIVELSEDGLTITPTGRAFVRNVCCVFDLRLRTEARSAVPVFSKSI